LIDIMFTKLDFWKYRSNFFKEKTEK